MKMGCPATPDYKSRFCLEYKNQAAELRSHDDQDLDKNEPSSSVAQSEWLTTGFKNGYPLPQLILSKATRKEAYYQAKHHVKKKDALLNEFIYIQVLWLGHPECSATWEPASNLPHSLIRDYEAGIESEVSLEKASMYGYISNVLHVSRKQSQGSISEPKK